MTTCICRWYSARPTHHTTHRGTEGVRTNSGAAVPTLSAAVPGSALRPRGSSSQIQTGVRAAGISVNQEAAGRGRAMDRQAVSAGWCERGQQAEDNRPARQCVLILQTTGYWRASTRCDTTDHRVLKSQYLLWTLDNSTPVYGWSECYITPSRHTTSNQFWFNVGPASQTVGQR